MVQALKTSQMVNEYKLFTRDSTAENVAVGKIRMNHYYAFLLSEANNYVVEKTKIGNLKDGQRSYLFPPDYYKIKTVRVLIDNQWHPLELVWSLEKWHMYTMRTGASAEGSIPERAIVINEQGNVHLELDPIPNADLSNALEIVYEGYQDALYFPDDYTTGTISITNGAAGVTGSGTTFTSAMVGRFLQPTSGKFWYDIKSYVSATSIALVNYFQESTILGSGYTIAELPRLPVEFHYTPVYGAVADYYRPNNAAKAKEFDALYARDLIMLQKKYQSKTKGRVQPGRIVNSGSIFPRVPWNYPNQLIGQPV